jgi:hypothetical protein
MMEKKIQSLEKQILKIKRELTNLSDLMPGSLSKQYNVCGNPNCRCKASPPQRHGPYYQVSYTRKGKSKSRFVRGKDLAVVKTQLKNYQRLRKLVDRWVDLAAELSPLKLKDADKQ